MLKRPMLLLAILSSIAVALVYYSFFTAIIFSDLCIILMFIVIYRKQSGVFILCGILLLCIMLSAAFTISKIEAKEKLDGLTAQGEFIVSEAAYDNGDGLTFTAETLECEYLNRGDKIIMKYNGPEIEMGKAFKGEVRISCLKDSPLALSYYSEGIYLSADLSKVLLTNNDDFILKGISLIRSYIKRAIFSHFDKEEAATMLAILTGDIRYFTAEFYRNGKAAGVAHVMVVSGMHLSIIVILTTYLLNKFFYNRYFKAIIILITVITVFAVCGFTMSVMRAGITYILMSLALALNRQSISENNLGTAVCMILLLKPLAIFNLAFLLSVLSTLGILTVALPVNEFINENKIIKSKIVSNTALSVIITLSAVIFTLPVTIPTFGYISNMSIATNLLVGLPVTAAIYLSLAGLVLPPLADALFFVANLIVKYVNFVINYFGSSPFAVTNLPDWAIILAIIAIFLIIYGLLACTKQNNVVKLKRILNKKILEGGGKRKWQSLMKKRLKKR